MLLKQGNIYLRLRLCSKKKENGSLELLVGVGFLYTLNKSSEI